MSDEAKLIATYELLASQVESAVEDFLVEAAAIIAEHPEWYEVEAENRSGGTDKVCAEGDALGKKLEEEMPKLEDAATYIESVGFDWWYLMDCLAKEVWKIVKRKQDEALLATSLAQV